MKKKEENYTKIFNWIKSKRLTDVKANIEGYETPSGFAQKGGEKTIRPDITANEKEAKYYFEIAIKPDNQKEINELISKWKMLSFMASRKKGKFYLCVPKGNKTFVQGVIDKHGIDANVISLVSQKK